MVYAGLGHGVHWTWVWCALDLGVVCIVPLSLLLHTLDHIQILF